jgi:hypothetical protein
LLQRRPPRRRRKEELVRNARTAFPKKSKKTKQQGTNMTTSARFSTVFRTSHAQSLHRLWRKFSLFRFVLFGRMTQNHQWGATTKLTSPHTHNSGGFGRSGEYPVPSHEDSTASRSIMVGTVSGQKKHHRGVARFHRCHRQ